MIAYAVQRLFDLYQEDGKNLLVPAFPSDFPVWLVLLVVTTFFEVRNLRTRVGDLEAKVEHYRGQHVDVISLDDDREKRGGLSGKR